MLAVGSAVMVTEVVAVTAEHPAERELYKLPCKYLRWLVLGVIVPVVPSIINPAAALNAPPAYAPVPVKVTVFEATVVQKGPPL